MKLDINQQTFPTGNLNCAVLKDLFLLLSAMHKISRFSLMIVLGLSILYLIEFRFKYEKMILQGFLIRRDLKSFSLILRCLCDFQ